ncbi:MAG: PQQ-dependent dehydrogenase, methanol/ethanol family [Nevskia sp.]|nr:PQQ-dependent dehydrogenase, methanol/ethanol family [Nevskia sp.]
MATRRSASLRRLCIAVAAAAALAPALVPGLAAAAGDAGTYGLGHDLQQHSPLKQVNRATVKHLVPVWNLSLSNNYPQETQPLVIGGVMYATTTDATVALDARSGRQLWRTPVNLPQDVFAEGCCGSHNRGAAAYDGKLFRGTLDAFVVALDLKTGKELWRQQAANYKDGYSMTGAPMVAGGVLITGIAGGEYGTRGFLDGWEPATGKHLWRRYTTAAPDEPGGDTWVGDNYLRGGGATWLTGSYDPDLDLVFWGVGNGGPWNPALRNSGAQPHDNLYICSAIAIRPKTGEIAWHYQFSPNDPFDYDGTNELVLADLKVGGQMRKVILQANRNGFFYVLDRATGKPLAANPFIDRINWAKGIDLASGRPIDTELTTRIKQAPEMAQPEQIFPASFGGKNWSPMSYDPRERLAYANTLNWGYVYRTEKQEQSKGQWFIAVDFSGWVWPADGKRGFLKAIDPLTGKARWQVESDIPYMGGVLSTDGGLVFTGAQTGEFMAFDSHTGKKLWQFQTGSGIVGIPTTWELNGRQYITVASGIGGAYSLFAADPRLNNVPTGGSLWTFALIDGK